jgi:hypothetical protein
MLKNFVALVIVDLGVDRVGHRFEYNDNLF